MKSRSCVRPCGTAQSIGAEYSTGDWRNSAARFSLKRKYSAASESMQNMRTSPVPAARTSDSESG